MNKQVINNRLNRFKIRGFTLIEMLVAASIVATPAIIVSLVHSLH